jgi:hypothetical protein
MAADFPECEFLGIDIAPLQPTTILPKNCSFEIANVLEGIQKPDNYFDYVHHRLLVSAIPADKWKQHIQECTRVCASGGWVEIIETDGQIINGGPACQQFSSWTTQALKTRGIDVYQMQNLDELMREAGLDHVTKQTIHIPIGPWGGKAGELFAQDLKLGSTSIQPFITAVFQTPKEEVERNNAQMLEEFNTYQAYTTACVYLGQKQ